MPVPQRYPEAHYDRLFSISDLHLGGATGFQIFTATDQLAWLIRHLASGLGSADERIALVINGDFVDFLAEAPAAYLDPDGAVHKLRRIAADPAFAPVFDALRTLLHTPNRAVHINLGNHDVELALPWVRAELKHVLTGGDALAQSRLHLHLNGNGVLLQVGDQQVLCLHGNEVDGFNFIEHEQLRNLILRGQCGMDVPAWQPNRGTQLVIDVMNQVKTTWPFIDLLKPEGAGLFEILAFCDPKLLRDNQKLFDAARQLTGGSLNDLRASLFGGRLQPDGMLSAPEGSAANSGGAPTPIADASFTAFDPVGLWNDSASRQMAPASSAALAARREQAAQDMLAEASQQMKQQLRAEDLVTATGNQQLGVLDAMVSLLKGDKLDALRESLESYASADVFRIDSADPTYTKLDKKVGLDIPFVLAGHTHHRKALHRRDGRGVYLNSGTWANLMQLRVDDQQDKQAFARFIDTLKASRTVNELVASGLAKTDCTVAAVERDPSGTKRCVGQLYEVTAHADSFALTPVAESALRTQGL